MKYFTVYSDIQPDCMFPSCLINNVIVIADSEHEARTIVHQEHGNDFVCDIKDAIVQELTKPILHVGYCRD